MLTAVICSGRNRPHCSNGQCETMANERRSYGDGDKPKQRLGAGVVEWANPTSSTYTDVDIDRLMPPPP